MKIEELQFKINLNSNYKVKIIFMMRIEEHQLNNKFRINELSIKINNILQIRDLRIFKKSMILSLPVL